MHKRLIKRRKRSLITNFQGPNSSCSSASSMNNADTGDEDSAFMDAICAEPPCIEECDVRVNQSFEPRNFAVLPKRNSFVLPDPQKTSSAGSFLPSSSMLSSPSDRLGSLATEQQQLPTLPASDMLHVKLKELKQIGAPEPGTSLPGISYIFQNCNVDISRCEGGVHSASDTARNALQSTG